MNEPSSESGLAPWRCTLRNATWMIGIELALVGGVFVADWRHHIYFSKTPYLLAIGWVSLALRGLRWHDIGFAAPARWMRPVGIGILVGVAMEGLELFATQPILQSWTGQYPNLSIFRSVVGNFQLLLVMVAGSWTLAALGEELVWRGYMLNRMGDLLGQGFIGKTLALLLVSALFGLAHADQGITGVIENGIAGLLLGLLYLTFGRQLLAPIVAHGVTDTLDSLLIFSGHYPGM